MLKMKKALNTSQARFYCSIKYTITNLNSQEYNAKKEKEREKLSLSKILSERFNSRNFYGCLKCLIYDLQINSKNNLLPTKTYTSKTGELLEKSIQDWHTMFHHHSSQYIIYLNLISFAIVF